MMVIFKVESSLLRTIRDDLSRWHEFAAERIGFVHCRFGLGKRGELIILAQDYRAVDDADYIRDSRFGALIGAGAFRKEMQCAYFNHVGVFHVHEHPGRGVPAFSRIDQREMRQFVPDFFNARSNAPHGAVVLSQDDIAGCCWLKKNDGPHPFNKIAVIGNPMKLTANDHA